MEKQPKKEAVSEEEERPIGRELGWKRGRTLGRTHTGNIKKKEAWQEGLVWGIQRSL